MPRVDPQSILTPITEAAIFLVLTVDSGAEQQVRELLTDLSGLRRSVGSRIPEAELSCVVGLGAELWDRLGTGPRPIGLHPFPMFAGEKHTAVTTAGDLLLHIRAHRMDMCFELAARLTERAGSFTRVVDEVHGFRFFDERDLLGFVDGTENPEGAAALAAITIGDEDRAFAGGSYVVVQKYVHDLEAWDRLSVAEQEQAIGRTKLSNVELSDEEKPANSHVALNTILDADGEQQQILRFNMPFGKVGAREFGTYFIGYARSPEVIEQMLSNMFIGNPPGNYDRILDFSQALSGSLFFVPTADLLDGLLTPTPALAPTSNTALDDGSHEDGSLGIGSLKERSQ